MLILFPVLMWWEYVVAWVGDVCVGATLSSFTLQEEKVCNVLRIVVLLLSLFLIVDVSISAFGNVPFCARSLCVGMRL